MNSKQHLVEEAERLYTQELFSIETISEKLKLHRNTVSKWKDNGDWERKKNQFLASKQSFHAELYELARKLMRDITADLDSGEKLDATRLNTFCRIIPMFTKVKTYEDVTTQSQKKPAYKGLTPDIIAQIEEEILGIKPSEPDDIDYDEEI